MQHRIKHVAGFVAREHAAGAVRTVGPGRQPQNQNATIWISKGRYRASPVFLRPIGAALHHGNIGAVLAQPRTEIALQNFLLQPIDWEDCHRIWIYIYRSERAGESTQMIELSEKSLTSGMFAVQNNFSPAAPAGFAFRSDASPGLHRGHTVSSMRRFPKFAFLRCIGISLILVAFCASAPAATRKKKHTAKPAVRQHTAVVKKTAVAATVVVHKATVTPTPGPVIRGGPWTEPTYADSTAGDFIDGEDLTIRKAAVDALGPYNGSVVVVDPQSGRILTMVNQRVALGSGFQPCSTIKLAVALAGLREKVIQPESKMRLAGMKMDLTYALAHSNN